MEFCPISTPKAGNDVAPAQTARFQFGHFRIFPGAAAHLITGAGTPLVATPSFVEI